MEKKLIIEINRYREIMGLPLIQLNEAVSGGGSRLERLYNTLDEVIRGGSRIINKLPQDPVTRTFKFEFPGGKVKELTPKRYGEISQAIRNKTPFKSLKDELKNDIVEFLDELGLLDGKRMYDDLIDEQIAAGGREDYFYADLIRRLGQPDRYGRTPNLDDILLDTFEDPLFVKRVKPTIQSKLKDFQDGKLVTDEFGRLTTNVTKDVERLKNLGKFTKQELDALSNPGFVSKIKEFFTGLTNAEEELMKLWNNLATSKDLQEIKQIQDLILKRMNYISNYKLQTYDYIKRFVDDLANSGDPTYIKLKQKLDDLRDKNGGWDAVKVLAENVPAWEKQWLALSKAWKAANGAERIVFRILRLDKVGESIVKWWKRVTGNISEESANKIAEELEEGEFTNTLLVGSSRGLPQVKVIDDVTGQRRGPDYYRRLKDLGGMPLAKWSYVYEYVIRLVKYKIYFAVAETIFLKIKFQLGLNDEQRNCLSLLTQAMNQQKIYDSAALIKPYQNKATWIPECLYQQDASGVGKIFSIADYIVSTNSSDGTYFWDEFLENIKKITVLRGITDLIPGMWDNFAYDGYKFINQYITESDLAGPPVNNPPKPTQEEEPAYFNNEAGFRTWCGLSQSEEFESFDNVNKIGKTKSGKFYKLEGTATSNNWVPTTGGTTTTNSEDLSVEEAKEFVETQEGLGGLGLNIEKLANSTLEYKPIKNSSNIQEIEVYVNTNKVVTLQKVKNPSGSGFIIQIKQS